MTKLYVYSTLSSDVQYLNYGKGGGDLPLAEGTGVLIKGGAGVANDRIVTPLGVVTEITPTDAEYLNKNATFLLHQKNGFVKIEGKKLEVEAVVPDMASRDESAPLIPEDFHTEDEGGNDPKPTTGGKKK